jgi:hypothetical protein
MRSAARSAIMIVGAFVLPCTMLGITEASSSGAPERRRCPYAPPSSASSCLERRSRSSLPRGMARILIIPWTPSSPHRRREIIQGEDERPCATRPMRAEARAVLTDALPDAHHWLDELTTSPDLTIGSLAAREGKTERWIRRTISLAFLSPALAKAAIEGRLPRGFGVKRLMDLPMVWPDQWSALGLRAPAER